MQEQDQFEPGSPFVVRPFLCPEPLASRIPWIWHAFAASIPASSLKPESLASDYFLPFGSS